MPRTCRPHGTPGNGGSSWTTPIPATTSASAVRLQARKVRSLAKVQRGSGSVPSSDSRGSVTRALPRSSVLVIGLGDRGWPLLQKSLQKSVGGGRSLRSYLREQGGPRAVPGSGHQGTTTIPALSASLPGAAGWRGTPVGGDGRPAAGGGGRPGPERDRHLAGWARG